MSSERPNLRVALDARPLTTSRAGIATYCRGLLAGLAHELDEVTTVHCYAKEAIPTAVPLAAGMAWRCISAPLWLPLAMPRVLRAGRYTLFHGTNHMAPPLSPVPSIITVHDLSALTMPENHTWRNRYLTVPQMLLSLRRAARLIAVSEYTARDLRQVPGIDPERIRVIYEAATPGLAQASAEAIRALRQQLDLPESFLLFLGALEPRKNVVTLLRAIAALHESEAGAPLLVVAGAEGWSNSEVYQEVARLRLEQQVRFLGYVPSGALPALYGAATALVYPSLFEGFGLPPLEAMACGTPVICSNSSSLPEVVGSAALLVAPQSVEDLAAALRRVLDDGALREALREAGLQRAALFSWERTARETLNLYREVAAEALRWPQ